ncbi:MAG: hypothetical protein IJ491_05955 [Clostridia bacterium]|nr:hypothetical protein [Clostridia bacterium]
MKTGKISDYLKYRNADKYDFDGYDAEIAEEFYMDDPNLEDFNYDSQDGRYCDS